jgi:sugar lactone lactonase YvrE
MRRIAVLATALSLAGIARATPPAGPVRNFGPNLEGACTKPEGIAVDPRGNLYASSFAFAPVANVCVLDREGNLDRVIAVSAGPAGVASLLGMLFVPREGLYACDFADGVAPHGRLLRIDPHGGATAVIATGFAAPNAIARDRHRRLYVSDSFAGTITRVSPDGSGRTTWAASPLLATQGQPPFGANGLAFDRDERFLYVANTGDDAILRIPVERDGEAGPVEVFARGSEIDSRQATTGALDGADGIQFDVRGNLWVCANQANEIQVLSPSGTLVARYAGAGPDALDFPASLIFEGRLLFLTNLSLGTGVNSKLSVLRAPWPGAPLRP